MSNDIHSAGKSTASAIGTTFKAIGALIFALIKQFGLYVPILYAVFGTVLCLAFDLRLISTELNSILFWIGGGLSLITSVAITIYKHRLSEEKKAESCPIRARSRKFLCPNNLPYRKSKIDSPKIYMSNLEPDKLIHEYEDRFIVYQTDERGTPHYIKTEYKYRS